MTSSAPGRVLALDVGQRRIGVAISDPDRIIASGRSTIEAKPQAQALLQICTCIEQEQAVLIVIGLPLTLRGEVGPQAQVIKQFATALGKATSIPIELHDERLTSVAADRSLDAMGVKKSRRKEHIDQLAAVFILQNFLDSQRTFRPWTEDEDEE